MIIREFKEMEWNEMYLSKGKEWKIMELSNLDRMFLNKGMEMNENEWNVSNLVWEQHGRNEMESFYDNITIRLLF